MKIQAMIRSFIYLLFNYTDASYILFRGTCCTINVPFPRRKLKALGHNIIDRTNNTYTQGWSQSLKLRGQFNYQLRVMALASNSIAQQLMFFFFIIFFYVCIKVWTKLFCLKFFKGSSYLFQVKLVDLSLIIFSFTIGFFFFC